MRTLRRAGAASLAALALAAAASGCTNADDQPDNAATPGQQPSVVWSSQTAAATDTPTAPTTPASSSGTPHAGGTTTATPTTALLDWKPLPGDPANTITTNGTQTLTIGQRGDWWSLGAKRTSVPKGLQVMKAGLDQAYAAVVYGNPAGTKGQTAVVTTLASGKQSTLDAKSDLPPSSDGSWALDGATLWHATGSGRSASQPYCLASTDLATMTSTMSWCAPHGDGFTNILATGGKLSMMTFDDARPTSCRTLVSVSGTQTTPYADVPACKGSQAVNLGDGSVWSIVPDEHRYQQIHVYASGPAGVTDLGLGVNSTLVACGDSVFWATDATGSTPAAVMRWNGSALTTAYEAKGLLGQPLCAAGHLSVVESGNAGDRQLTARVD